ncbi:MAG: leucine-rich repeat protein [Clostridia bacterium]|nr:leucine-rich repeat protein [Clostridia bacterium]
MKRFILTVFFVIIMLCSLIIVSSAKEAYLEEIPENLLFENDTVTHFIVFDDEKYYLGSGDTLNKLNTENMDSSLVSLGIDKSEIGTKYLTKLVFPAYLNGTLVTYVDVNTSIKTNTTYFRDKCGYVKFPGTMTKTHDMNQCTGQLRGIDFGENSQLTSIPYCFAPNSSRLKEVKNFPTANLETIEASAFNNSRYAFSGELVINAKTVKQSAFNNSLTYVTSMVIGEKVERIETQAFSVRSSETGSLGNPLLEYIEFKCDVTKIQSTSYGPFYFELGRDSRSEYTSLKCIVLSNEANKGNITEGVTTFRDIVGDSTYMRFLLDTTKELVYTSHNVNMDNATVSYDSFLENGTLTGYCDRCGKAEVSVVEPLFTFKGISVPTNGDIEIYIGYSANYDAISQYEKITGNKVNFGIVAAAKSLLGDKSPLDENGNETLLQQGAVIKAPVSNGYAYESYEFIIRGFTTEAHKDALLLMASYVHITDKDGNTVSVNYLQSKQVVDNNFIYISYNSYED